MSREKLTEKHYHGSYSGLQAPLSWGHFISEGNLFLCRRCSKHHEFEDYYRIARCRPRARGPATAHRERAAGPDGCALGLLLAELGIIVPTKNSVAAVIIEVSGIGH
jgi:hypothetical protein